ncbi:Trifunctional UDP-glucose 4,6-dehydratase/UDP-4-keto-6-deoxy-D-glucose 3,5-epimerase/UDP-4-keto-L-rhamnose-reductase RHM1 [Linum grandiflorum]
MVGDAGQNFEFWTMAGTATYKPKNILITGAAGFIASHVCNRLIRNYPDYNVVVLDKLDYCSNLNNLNPSRSSPNFKFVKGDIASADMVNFILLTESIDTIMHFAAQTHVDNSFGNSFEFTENNIYGTHVLLEACRLTGGRVKRFIHVSTDEVYGETDEDAVVGNHEACQLLPTNPYSATKAAAEMLVMAYGTSYGLPVITTRGNNVYGPNQFPEKLIPKFILLAMMGKPLPIHGDGSNVRSYLYCEDVAEAFEVVLHKGEVGHVYNIGTKKERRVLDVASDICKMFSLNPNDQIKFVENRPFNDQRYYLDDQKLKSLGWFERTTWEEGLKKTMEWYTTHPGFWGDVSGALLPHPRMLVATAGTESHIVDSRDIANNDATVKKPLMKFLIYGRTGWIASLLGKACEKRGIAYEFGKGRLENRSQISDDISEIKPTHVFNVFETNKTDQASAAGVLTLADVCKENDLMMMNYGDSYGAMVEELIREYDNVCNLIVHMPISSDLTNPRNFVAKIAKYDKVANVTNSMTVLDELVPISIEMAKRNLRGVWNFTNPGVVTQNELLEMYRDYIDPNFKWTNFTTEEQTKISAAVADNGLDSSKLESEFPEILDIKESLVKYVFEPNKKMAY